jgi:F-type H+-transporting ATPase subunit epsilon
MAETIRLEVVTPAGIALAKDVSEFTAPSVEGEFGVLPGHLPILVALRPGTISYRVGGEEHRVLVAHGFAEVVGEKALVLTEKFARKDDVDVVAVRARLRDVEEELAAWQGDVEDEKRLGLIEEEQWLAAELELIGDPPLPTVREDTRFYRRMRDEEVASEEPSDSSEAK